MTSRPYKIPRSVLVVIHTPALDVLLIERADKPGYWQSVTGSLDHEGEPLETTARREVLEETGIAGGVLRDWGLRNVYEIYPVWRHRYADGVSHNTEHVFGLTVDAGTPVALNPREHLAYAWLPWREAADRCFSPSNAEAILQLPNFMEPPSSLALHATPEASPFGPSKSAQADLEPRPSAPRGGRPPTARRSRFRGGKLDRARRRTSGRRLA